MRPHSRLAGSRPSQILKGKLKPEEVIEIVKASGLRGRGGAGRLHLCVVSQ